MKVLVFYVNSFNFKPKEKNLNDAPDPGEGSDVKNAILAFIQVEKEDEEKDLLNRKKSWLIT